MDDSVLWLLRNMHTREVIGSIDDVVWQAMDDANACDSDSEEEFYDEVMELSIARFVRKWPELSITDDFLALDDIVYEIITNWYQKEIIDRFKHKNCY